MLKETGQSPQGGACVSGVGLALWEALTAGRPLRRAPRVPLCKEANVHA